MRMPRYLPLMIAEFERVVRAEQPGTYLITVRHDSWCRLLAGRGSCNCEPEIAKACASRVLRIN